MRRTVRAILFLAIVCGPVVANDDWPAFRGPTGDGIATAKGIPTAWSETNNVRWKVAIHDKGWSSPVVLGGQVWLTTAKEDGSQLFAICLDLKTGKTIHDLKLFDVKNPPNIAQFNSHASPTPVLDGDRAYIHFGSYGTVCLERVSGKELWRRDDLPCDHWRGPASSPIVYKDKLFLLFDGYDKQYVACLDKANGKTVWTKDRVLPYPENGDLKKAFATPAVFEIGGKAQVVCSAAMGTIAHDVETGNEVWRVIHGGMNEASRPILAHDLIYVSTGHVGNLLAIRAGKTGDLTSSNVAWKVEKMNLTRPSPLVVGNEIYALNDLGILSCLDAKTGKKHWQERLPNKHSASPVYADGHIYCIAETGEVSVVKAGTTPNILATNKLDMTKGPSAPKDSRCMASPAVVNGAILFRTHTHLYCIGEK
jgi:outer membrane protein assembly factor BamB